MNFEKLKHAEADFLDRFPGGFSHPDLVAIVKKHKMEKMVAFAQEVFSKDAFEASDLVLDHLSMLVSRSSLISLFEKPRFKEYIFSLSSMDRHRLVAGLRAYLHGNQKKGFEAVVEVLEQGKLARWSLMTIAPAYFNPTQEVFIKPNTAKGIIAHFEIDSLVYHSKPTWEFYTQYRTLINDLKPKVSPELSTSNAAFCGFLMMSFPH